MRIRVEQDDKLTEDELILKYKEWNEEIISLQEKLFELVNKPNQITFYKGEVEYYLPVDDILFFETNINNICAHTKDDIYEVKYKLYELEELLPMLFMRVSKSTIVNVSRIYSIKRNISSSSAVQFQQTHKEVYVSRMYYKALKNKLEEMRR